MDDRASSTRDRTNIQMAAMLFGIIFILVGIAGFIPGITTQYSRLSTFDGEGAKVIGVIGVNWLENGAHLLYGVAGLALASTWSGARTYFIVGGALYLVLWIYGLAIDLNSSANFLGVNVAANWLHFVLAVVMIGIGLVLGRKAPGAAPGRAAPA